MIFRLILRRIAKNPAQVFILVQRMKSMGGFEDYFLHQEYTKIAGLGNKLGEVRDLIDWE